ncbi:MAG: prenyltransferase/squalene oxidase repeat-containing protein [Planctomycetota bacterium]|nr:prenyltransferase/squalene oxidase repeat-containing protein [Planctomycetota bacterium]
MNNTISISLRTILLAQQAGNGLLMYSLWIGFGILMIMAAILIWTRWGHAKPIWKCVALSIFAHILLGGYAYGTRLFFSFSNESQEKPVSFSVIQEEPLEPELDPNSNQNEKPWDQFFEEKNSSPESITQPNPEPHLAAFPKRESRSAVTEYQNHEIQNINDSVEPDQPTPELVENQQFEINRTQKPKVEPAKVAEIPKPIRRDTPFQIPKPADRLVERSPQPRSSQSPPEFSTTQSFDVETLKAELQKQVTTNKAKPVPGPNELPDSSSIPDTTSKPPWASASHPNVNAAISQVKIHRRLADGQPIPEMYQNRFSPNRSKIIEHNGGSINTEQAVQDALNWLSSEQSEDGRWNPRRFNAGNEANVYGHNRGGAGFNADTGITGLVLLSFLGSGHTHLEGPYQKTIQKGLEYLIRTQEQDGNLYGEAGLFARTYCHGMAMMAISEAYSLTGDVRIQPFIQKAQQYSVSTQNQVTGGWRYRPGDDGDMSQFGWQVLALKSAEQAGVLLPEKTRNLMERFLNSYKKGDRGGLAAYRTAEKPTRTMTAEALFCRRLLEMNVSTAMSTEAIDFVLEEMPNQTRIDNLYFWYYATLAIHREKSAFEFQNENWKRWNHSLTQKLLSLQSKEGSMKGSFSEKTLWSPYGGTFYSTAMSTLCLEVYYRYHSTQPPLKRTARR